MADLSFNIVALDKAGATFIKLADQVDKLSDKLERLDRKDVTANVNVKTDESHKALDSFTTRYQLMAAGIAAASPAIGAAIVAGVGAGFIGVAAIAQSSNAQVQEAYKGLWRDVVATTQNATDQLVPTFVAAANQMDAAVQQMAPQLEKAFAAAGPGITALTRGVTDAATNAMPGLTTAMQNSLPVMEGAAAVMSDFGEAAGQGMAELSQHSEQLGVSLQSFGSIVSSVLGTVIDLVGDIADAWAENAGSINGSVAGIADTVSGLAQGVLPAFTAALGAAAAIVEGITDVLGPLAPVLGFVGAAALATWAAFKLAGLATVGVRALALGVVNLGANMEVAAAKSGAMVAGLRGVSVAASTTATTVTAAGRATATAAVTMGAAMSAVAGPLGIILVAGAALYGLFASSQDDAAESAQALAAGVDTVTNALIANHGAVNQSVEDTVKTLPAWGNATKYVTQFGITHTEMVKAVTQGGATLQGLQDRLDAVAASADRSTVAGRAQASAAQSALQALSALADQYQLGAGAAEENAAANERVARATIQTAEFQAAAAGTAQTLGLALGSVTGGYVSVIASGSAASSSVQDVSAAFIKSALSIAQAQQSITDHFLAADRAVATAAQGLADANRATVSATRAVTDATRQATSAQQSYVQAQEQERKAQVALHEARAQAIQDLKELHLQLADQEVSEQEARLRLFDATRDAASAGVDVSNAQAVAMQEVTAENEAQIKAALNLVSAQNALNNTMNSGQKLRADVVAADKAGVDGAKNVVAAQDGLTKAQKQVADAAYSVQRAQQAVTDAEYSRARASDRVSQAQRSLADAQAAASRSLDINTKAGQQNLQMLLTLWGAISATGMPMQDRYNALINNTATALGLSTTAAQQYLTQLGLIPKDFKYNITAVAGADLTEITKTTINGVTIFQSALGQGGIASAGRLASGGPVVGPGGPRDDLVPLWGSNGEFMQPADAVSHYGVGFMEAVRTKRLKVMGGDGAAIPGYKDGGLIEAIAAYTNLSTAYVTDVNALGVMGMPRPPQLPKYVPSPVMAGMTGSGTYTPAVGGSSIAGLQQFALAQRGKLYQWGATGPNTWDCSGLVGAIWALAHGLNPYKRYMTTAGMGVGKFGMKPGPGPVTVYLGPGHTAANIAGLHAEAYGGNGVPLAIGRIGTPLSYYKQVMHLRDGGLVGLARDPRARAASFLERGWPEPEVGGYKNGGWLMPGQLAYNETTKPEAVFNQEQLTALSRRKNERHFHLHMNVSNTPVDLMTQWTRAEMLEPSP